MGVVESVAGWWVSHVAPVYKAAAEHLYGKPLMGLVEKAWDAELDWSKRHPTIASFAAGTVVGLIAAPALPFVLGASATAALGTVATAMLAAGFGAAAGAAARYLTAAGLTNKRVSGADLLRETVLAGSIGLLTGGLGSVVAKALGPLASTLFRSPAVQTVAAETAADAGVNVIVKTAVAANQKLIDNVVENIEHDKSWHTDPYRGVPIETAKEAALAVTESVVQKVGLAAAGSADVGAVARGVAPLLAGVAPVGAAIAVTGGVSPVSTQTPAASGAPRAGGAGATAPGQAGSAPGAGASAPGAAPQPPRRGFTDLLDLNSPSPAAAPSEPTPAPAPAPTTSLSPSPSPSPTPAASPAPRPSASARDLENTPFGD